MNKAVNKGVNVPEELIALLRREAAAMEHVEGRLRTLELLAGADQQRFVTVALDELEVAAEQLASLEIARSIALLSAGFSPHTTAAQLVDALDGDGEARVGSAVESLRVAAGRLVEARDRASAAVAGGRDAISARLEASGLPAMV